MQAIVETMNNGIRFEVAVVGDGSIDDPFRPEVFDTHPTGYFHLERVDESTSTAVVWLNKNRSPGAVVTDIRNANAPLGTVLKETGT